MTTKLEYDDKCKEILKNIPAELHQPLENFCYSNFHGCGYSDVLLYLQELVDALTKPLLDYGKRIQSDTIFLMVGPQNKEQTNDPTHVR